MKLTKETLKKIKVGDVVKFNYANGGSNKGEVFGLPADGDWGILCSNADEKYFGVSIFDGSIDFEFIK